MTNDINSILAQKRAWRNSEHNDRRQGNDRRVKDGTPEERKDLSDTLKAGKPFMTRAQKQEAWQLWVSILLALIITILICVTGHAQELNASWYSVESLKKEGTWTYSHGRMANGHIFNDNNLTCATRLFPLGSTLRIENSISKRFVYVKVSDRIGKRFARKRIDLSKRAFGKIAELKQGLIPIKVTLIKQ